MGASKELMFRMREEEYYNIPIEVRERYLSSKNLTPEINDFDELIKDENFVNFRKEYKAAKKKFEDYQYILREKLRNEKLKK